MNLEELGQFGIAIDSRQLCTQEPIQAPGQGFCERIKDGTNNLHQRNRGTPNPQWISGALLDSIGKNEKRRSSTNRYTIKKRSKSRTTTMTDTETYRCLRGNFAKNDNEKRRGQHTNQPPRIFCHQDGQECIDRDITQHQGAQQ